MNNFFKYIFAPILVIGAGYFFFNKPDMPNVQYSLSERLEAPTLDSSGKVIRYQIIQIKNSGKAKSERIRIFIPVTIKQKPKINKANVQDSINFFPQSEQFEFFYSELEPDRSFSLSFIPDRIVGENEINIFDSRGKILSVFSSKNNDLPWWVNIIATPLVLWLYWMLLFFWLDYPEKRAGRNPQKALKAKLFYISKEKDKEYRAKAIQAMIQDCKNQEEYFITSTKCYQMLNQERPTFFQDEEWKGYKDSLIHLLSKRIESWIAVAYKPSDFDKLLSVVRPLHFPELEWKDIKDSIAQRYLKYLKDQIRFIRLEDIPNKLAAAQLPNLADNYWGEFQEWLTSKTIYEILTDRYFLSNPDKLEKYNLDSISDDRKKPLKEIQQAFYFKEILLDILIFENKGQKFISTPKESYALLADAQYDFIKRVVENKQKIEQMNNENASEKSRLKELESEIEGKRRNLQTQEVVLAENKRQIESQTNEVHRKLVLIDAAFNTPSRVATLESDSSPFNDHNTQNLKKLAQFIQFKLNSGGIKNA